MFSQYILLFGVLILLIFCWSFLAVYIHKRQGKSWSKAVSESERDWREKLSEQEFNVLREKGTDPAFKGEYTDLEDVGEYVCAGCGQKLFSSKAKFHSGSGWPSFFKPGKDAVDECLDISHGMKRTEITCSNCGGHLGHVFDDGPQPTGKRYCVNSTSLRFKKEEKN